MEEILFIPLFIGVTATALLGLACTCYVVIEMWQSVFPKSEVCEHIKEIDRSHFYLPPGHLILKKAKSDFESENQLSQTSLDQ